MTTKLKFATICAVFGLTACGAMAPAPVVQAVAARTDMDTGMINAIVERQDTIVATGYAVIGVQNHKNAPQQRLLAIRAAKVDAYRGLSEQVYGLYLDSNTTVSDMTVMSDTFRTRVEGVIYGASLTSITPVNNDTYEVTLSLNSSAVRELRLLYLSQLSRKKH